MCETPTHGFPLLTLLGQMEWISTVCASSLMR
jgi:hypothetical protein